MQFIIRNTSWFKRRPPTAEVTVTHVDIPNITLTDNSYCDMHVMCSDNSIYTLSGRVNQNDISKKWTINGLNPDGLQVLVDIIEDDKV